MADGSDMLLVITTLPGRDAAMALARALVDQKLAACVHVAAAGTSVYRWHGEVETADEVTLLAKTQRGLYGQIEAAIREAHPYELPEIIAVRVVHGLPQYLEWVAAETLHAPG